MQSNDQVTAEQIGVVRTHSTSEMKHESMKTLHKARAECPPRGPVAMEARVAIHAGDHFQHAVKEAEEAAVAEREQNAAHEAHKSARPTFHARNAMADVGAKLCGNLDGLRAAAEEKKHSAHAEAELKKAEKELEDQKREAREMAIRAAEGKAAVADGKAHIEAEYKVGPDNLALAEMPGRAGTIGVGVVLTHAQQHLQKAEEEKAKAEAAAAEKDAAYTRASAAHPGSEAATAVGGVGKSIKAHFKEMKSWFSAKLHSRSSKHQSKKGQDEMEKARALARETAIATAEQEAAKSDHAVIVGEKKAHIHGGETIQHVPPAMVALPPGEIEHHGATSIKVTEGNYFTAPAADPATGKDVPPAQEREVARAALATTQLPVTTEAERTRNAKALGKEWPCGVHADGAAREEPAPEVGAADSQPAQVRTVAAHKPPTHVSVTEEVTHAIARADSAEEADKLREVEAKVEAEADAEAKQAQARAERVKRLSIVRPNAPNLETASRA